MPELPEVETTKRGIEPHVLNQKILSVSITQPKLRWPIPPEIASLKGQSIHTIQRRAKYLLLQTKQGSAIVHLGMSGSLRIINDHTERRPHDHVELVFNNGTKLRYHDPRRFGCWLWSVDPLSHKLLLNLGPEPFESRFNGEYLYQLSRNKKTSIKQWIMDNKVVVGVGNIYACESLFLAKIKPQIAAGKVSKKRYSILANTIVEVLNKAISMGGTTLKDFVNPADQPGYFAQQLWVYGRENQRCEVCSTLITKATQGQRSTFYCPDCQKK